MNQKIDNVIKYIMVLLLKNQEYSKNSVFNGLQVFINITEIKLFTNIVEKKRLFNVEKAFCEAI